MISTLDDSGRTQDAFLGGRLKIWQPRVGYRAGVDPVLLAASVQTTAGERVFELGCGVGVASLCLAWRTGAMVCGLEVQSEYAALARLNGANNEIAFDVIDGDLRDMPMELRSESFDHVIANPPYYDRSRGTKAPDAGREAAMGEGALMANWVDAGVRRLKPRGYLTMIQRSDRLPDLLSAMDGRLGDVSVLPIAPRTGRAAELVIVRARKGARGPFRLLSPIIMHEGDRHLADGESYNEHISNVLRHGAALESGW